MTNNVTNMTLDEVDAKIAELSKIRAEMIQKAKPAMVEQIKALMKLYELTFEDLEFSNPDQTAQGKTALNEYSLHAIINSGFHLKTHDNKPAFLHSTRIITVSYCGSGHSTSTEKFLCTILNETYTGYKDVIICVNSLDAHAFSAQINDKLQMGRYRSNNLDSQFQGTQCIFR